MANEHTVYALVDPREPDRIRYVGITADARRRYKEHAEKHDKGRGRKSAWLASLSNAGVRVEMRVIGLHVTRLAARVAEWETVKAMRAKGQCDFNDPIPAPVEHNPPCELTGAAAWQARYA